MTGQKVRFQSAEENLQRRRRPDRLQQTVPDRCSSRWKGAVANGKTHSERERERPSYAYFCYLTQRGSKGRGAELLVRESVFGRLMKTTNWPTFHKIGTTENHGYLCCPQWEQRTMIL